MSEELQQSSNVKNILTIDFNIIMYPCIKLYRDISSNENENPSVIWNTIENYRGVSKEFLQYDARTYNKLVKFVQLAMQQDKEVELINPIKQDKIPQILSVLYPEELGENYRYNIMNIDFFHDLLSTSKDRNNITRFNKYDSNSWAGYLMLKDKINNYIWVKAPNSDGFNMTWNKDDIKFYSESVVYYLDYPENIIADYPFDKVFISFPENYVPNQYKHLFNLFFELFLPKEKGWWI